MIDTTYAVEISEVPTLTQALSTEQDARSPRLRDHLRLRRQVLRFSLVGGLNTLVHVQRTFLGKRETKGAPLEPRQGRTPAPPFPHSSLDLALVDLLVLNALHPFLVNPTLWANASKVLAIGGTALISYLGIRLWVFVSQVQKEQPCFASEAPAPRQVRDEHRALPTPGRRDTTDQREHRPANEHGEQRVSGHSLSLVLPAYNEEQVIGSTLEQVLNVLGVLAAWVKDFEVIVVNDGSTDRTGEIVSTIAEAEPRVRLVTHERNQGYGAALADGFAAAMKELTLFMDSDGQFNIRDLTRLLPFIDEYDAVIGYRINRQDSWMRKLNAWGWKCLIGWVLGVHVRDVDCAFKLLHTEFLHEHPLETRGAMINAELLYKLKHAGCTYREAGIDHLPRQGGRATGARPGVILRALRELFVSARKWHREEQRRTLPGVEHELPTRSRA